MKLPNLFNKYKKDELLGCWDTEDGSGFSMIMGTWLEIKSDGSGKYESWHNDPMEEESEDDSYHVKGTFTWERLSENAIKIIEITENSERVEEIVTYSLKKVNGRIELSSSYPELEKVGLESFWKFGQVLFKAT